VSTATEINAEVELDSRQGDGLEVSLYWNRRSGRVWVDVCHVHSGESFTVDADPARALEVFQHPFAFCLAAAA
jgi:hypothetical protein